MNANNKIEKILEFNSEGHALDYKIEQYPIDRTSKKHEILKDISAFANHPSNEEKFIIIGVTEKNGIASEFQNIENLIDQSNYQQYINENIEPHINFEYKSIIYKNTNLAYFRIHDNTNRPYLFKKDVTDSSHGGKMAFKVGDGFIRSGTSTRKLKRSDFDLIYEEKNKIQDRKSDLIINNYAKSTIVNDYGVKCLDISIKNTSNRSINLDVEIKFYKEKGFELISEYDFKSELYDKRVSKSIIPQGMFFVHESRPLHILFEDHHDMIILKTNMIISGTSSTLLIRQNEVFEDVFSKHMLILNNEKVSVKAEVIIRCDDFTEGLLIKEITFDVTSLGASDFIK